MITRDRAYPLPTACWSKLLIFFKLVVALAAIYRSTFTGLERHFCVFTTLGTHCREHLASEAEVVSVTLGFSCFAARWATLGFMSIAFSGKELLFLSGESESRAAISALKRFLYITHWMTSSILNCWLELRSLSTLNKPSGV